MVIAGCVTAAVAAVVAGTLAFGKFNGEERPAGADSKAGPTASPAGDRTQSRALLKVPPTPHEEDESNSAEGSWVTSRTYASGAVFGVLGYDLDSGKQTWKVPLDGDLCAASRDVTSGGLVAVVFTGSKSDDSKCSEIAVIDIDQGRKVWQKSMPEATRGLDLGVGVSEDFAAVGWPYGQSWGFDVHSGRTVWDSPPAGCGSEEYQGLKTLMGIAYCDDRLVVMKRDPRTGEASRFVTLPEALHTAYIASADPLVVAGYAGDEEYPLDANRLLTFGEDGSLKATVEIDDYVPGCRNGEGCGAVVAGEDTVYVASKKKGMSSGNHIAAFDANTGRRKWTVDGVSRSQVLPLRADEDGLIAYSNAGVNRDGSGVIHLAAADAKQTLLLRQPNGFEVSNSTSQLARPGMRDPVLYEDGRLFFHRASVSYSNTLPMSYAFTIR
ncbi:PQQ-like beta-propeller repeat protein [Streptomyces sp. NBC_01754]|uniref:outer membrane protein assembly factor BamB family protein n=1 Tax=Streptomyces sp. NBC_01754 TaxID=2975930 RepID=UPI002DDA9FEE|nr:PQQ-binding-like beta-propeller repeat protein [Streptomyces sp. NBC_01754]WSC96430.1 PQQ-like beta-propeller repeat protein [Streptomyces sp. NBC_01754]